MAVALVLLEQLSERAALACPWDRMDAPRSTRVAEPLPTPLSSSPVDSTRTLEPSAAAVPTFAYTPELPLGQESAALPTMARDLR